MKKTIVYLVVLVVVSLGAGVVLGMGIGRNAGYAKHLAFKKRVAQGECRPQMRKHMLEVLSRKLNLSTEQKAKVKDILDTSRAKVEASKKEAMQNFTNIREEANTKIRQILTLQQQTEFDRLNAERKEHEFSNRRIGPPGTFDKRHSGPDREGQGADLP